MEHLINKQMDLEKIKIKKTEAQKQILIILDNLAKETGCEITKLEYRYENTGYTYTKGVSLKITLEV